MDGDGAGSELMGLQAGNETFFGLIQQGFSDLIPMYQISHAPLHAREIYRLLQR